MASESFKPAAAPLLKWAGGKSWAVKHLGEPFRDYLATSDAAYIEPFLGSAAMAAALAPEVALLSDAIPDLISLYRCLQNRPGELAWALSAYATYGIDEAAYYAVRDQRPEDLLYQAARMIYLNRLSFNGLYRVNRKGAHNVPYGDAGYRPSVVGRKSRDAIGSLFPHKGKLEALGAALRGAVLLCQDFAYTVAQAPDGALIYADPPYHGVYDSYTAEGFSEADHIRLATALWHAHARGCKIVLHNSKTELIQYLYGDWLEVLPIDEKRPIAADPSKRERAKCVIASNHSAFLSAFR